MFHVFINNERLGEGEDTKKRTAVNLACRMAFQALQNRDHSDHQVAQPPVVSSPPPANPLSSNASPAQTPSPINGATCEIKYDQNYIGKFNEFCQKKGWMRYSFVDNRKGPDHIPEFFCSALIEDRKFPEAKGKNKKEAQHNAALLALQVLKRENPELQHIPDPDDTGMEEGENTSDSGSSSNISSNKQSPESTQSESAQSESSDSQITFRSSVNGTPIGTPIAPSKPQRRIELAANFSNCVKASDVPTEDENFLQAFDNIIRLDSGGFGTVYKATKKLEKTDYAVKKIKIRSEKDVAEVETLAHLQHQHIVRYFSSWTGEDYFSENSCSTSGSDKDRHKAESLFIQMEWCANGTLESWIEKMDKIDKLKSLDIFRQIVHGVEYIHSEKVIHRDLKPVNILFSKDMTVKIADFGLATPMSLNRGSQALVRTRLRGTKRYMAPEQENDTYENEVDIFPLGLILIELFWKFDTCHMKQKEWEKLRNAELPSKFVQQFPYEEPVIKLMLSKEPKKRPTASYLKNYFDSKSLFHSKTQ
ncbi:interferon-induced, double-stranded RNA-activated protein kinase-like [Mixophyes fleayi]|uniref:interferon-induced, double-stranded RNA-activated protein kinase-like n=1 Tax=Mixophyes fleayi TaxID=3061075 RepID=UPI003F4DA050